MLQRKSFIFKKSVAHFAASAASAKKSVSVPELIAQTSEDGIKITCISHPALCTGLSRVVAVFKSGARNEINSVDRGLSHLIRRSFGISTGTFTAVNLTRHLEQMGAQVNVLGTREHTIYTVDVAPNLASRAGYLLTHMATATAFYNWELKDIVYKLMRNDIERLNRTDLSGLCTELLHEAAFGNHPDGTLLGRSLYSTDQRIGSYSLDQIMNYLQNSVMPGRCAITLMNVGDGHQHMDPMASLHEIRSGLSFHPPIHQSQTSKHDFVGNEIRRDMALASSTHAMLACHVPGGRNQAASHLSMAVAAQALHGGVHNISYADAGSRASRLGKTVGDYDDRLTQCGSIYHSYSDHGLFGVAIVGSCGRATGARVAAVAQTLKELAKTGFSIQEIEIGKALVKSELALKAESMQRNAVDVSLQMLETGTIKNAEQMMAEVDKLTPESINQVVKQVLSLNKMAMSVVGANTALIPPLNLLK